jgi:hypothetical protein
MATRQTSKQAKTKAEAKVDPGVISNKPGGTTERPAPRRDAQNSHGLWQLGPIEQE